MGQFECVKELLKVKDIDLDLAEPKGSTPLHAASFGCHGKIVALLLGCGANPEATKKPLPGKDRGLKPREEAQGEARDVWKLHKEGGVALLQKKGYQTSVSPEVQSGRSFPFLSPKQLKKKKAVLDDIPLDVRKKLGTLLVQIDSQWKERGVVFYQVFGSNRLAAYKNDAKEPTIELEIVFNEDLSADNPPFGVTIVGQEADQKTFFVRGVIPPAAEEKETFFKASTMEEMHEWLNLLYKTCMPQSAVKVKRVDLDDLVNDKGKIIKLWNEYADKGLFVGNDVSYKKKFKDDINTLIVSIENITEPDVYYKSFRKLIQYAATLPRGDEVRDSLSWITKQPRPHDMNLILDGNGISEVGRFRTNLNKLKDTKSVPATIKKVLLKLDQLYLSYENSRGAQPRPALLRSGEARIGSRVVPEAMAKRLLDPSANTKEGIHFVVKIGKVFFKVNPTAPSYEMAVGELSRLIWRQGTALALIVKIELGDHAVVCQAATAIDGLLLRDFIREVPHLIKHLDQENYSVQYMAATLYRPLDGKLDNLIVNCEDVEVGDTVKKKLNLVSIDSDECFGDEFFACSGQTHEISCKFAVWLLPQSVQSKEYSGMMNENACNMFLQRSGEFIVISLILFLLRQNQKLNTLYDEGVITKDELLGDKMDRNPLVALLRPGESIRLLKDISKAQEVVRSNLKTLSFQKFFTAMFPIMSKFYDFARTKISPDLSNFQQIIEDIVFGFSRPLLETYKELVAFWPTIKEDLQVYTKKSSAYISERSVYPEEELEALLEAMDFSLVPESDQEEILWDVVRIPLKKFTIRNSSVFNKKHLEDLVAQQVFSHITIEGCPKINSLAVKMLTYQCKQFTSAHNVTIKIINCPNVRKVLSNERVNVLIENSKATLPLESSRLAKVTEELKNPLFPAFLGDSIEEILKGKEGEANQLIQKLKATPLSQEVNKKLMELSLANDIFLEAIEVGNLDLLIFLHHVFGKNFPEESSEREILLNVSIDFMHDKIAHFLIENTKAIRFCTFEMCAQAIRTNMLYTAASIILSDPSLLVSTDDKGNTPLLLACASTGQVSEVKEFIKLILQLDPAFYEKNNEGRTATHIAIAAKNLPLYNFLIAEGFKSDAKGLTLAIEMKHKQLISALLQTTEVDLYHLTLAMSLSDDLEYLELLLSKTKDLTQSLDSARRNILYYVENIKVATILLEKEPKLLETPGPTLHFASQIYHTSFFSSPAYIDLFRFMVKSNPAHINALTSDGLTPLTNALLRKQGGEKLVEVVGTLLELKADPTVPTQKNQPNILHLSIMTGYHDVVQRIVAAFSTPEQKKLLGTLALQGTEGFANCYLFAKSLKNLEIYTTMKDIVAAADSKAILNEETTLVTVFLPSGEKKTLEVKENGKVEDVLKMLKARGVEVDKLVCKCKNKKVAVTEKISNLKVKEIQLTQHKTLKIF
uniref:PH domain-containing protein n=1 Tax=Arcella intermedia TaxID=1963864 RepID=A0A6B2KW37_9EUKA